MKFEEEPVESQAQGAASHLKDSQISGKRQLHLNDIVTKIPGIAWESWGVPGSDEHRVVFFNDFARLLLGYSAEEWEAMPKIWNSIIHPDDREAVQRLAAEKYARGQDYSSELRWITRDGRPVWVERYAAIKRDEQGRPTGFRGLTVDVTHRKLIEAEREQLAAALEAQTSRLQHVFDHAPSFIVTLRGPEMIFEMANPVYYRLVGHRELIGRTVREALPELEDQIFHDLLENVYRTGETFVGNEVEVLLLTPDGSRREKHYVNIIYSPLREPDDSISGIVAYGLDVTEQVLSRIKIAESEERYHSLFQSNPLPMWVFDLETLRFLSVNDAAIVKYGYSEEEFLNMSIMEIRPPGEIPQTLAHLQTNYSGTDKSYIFKHRKKDGTEMEMEISSNRIVFNGRIAELVLAHDVTERRKAELALSRAEENYRRLIESSPGIVYLNEPHPPYATLYVSPNIRMLGYTPEDFYADPGLWKSRLHPDDRERVIGEFRAAVAADVDSELKYRILARDGSIHWLKDKARFVYDAEGRRTGWQGILLDITATKDLEEQLRQSQKLESIGLLAGGIAHDFNNMLTAINGYSELTLRQLKKDDPLRRNLEEIKKAGQHSADLTRQLLAFSRRQVLQPKVTDLNETIAETIKLLERLVGEDIELQTSLSPKTGRVIVDPGQFTQIILNLAVNARDAMPQGGRVTIETSNVFLDKAFCEQYPGTLPGAYVMTSIGDTGEGMNEETMRHIFEPFFTTKELGHGTGLGLATVYGIVKQSGGTIEVSSREEHGTIFKIYLPRVTAEVVPDSEIHTSTDIVRGTETILLVEDENLVRNLTRTVLEELGYRVIEARSGPEALEICAREDCQFDLLLTDVVMPQMSGHELAERLSEKIPGLPVLFTSGYTGDAVIRHGVVESSSNFIQKPFSIEGLSNKVKQIFEQDARPQ